MTYAKRGLSLVLIVIMVVSMMAVPAFAASGVWTTRFRQFPSISTGTTRYGYVKALQTFLLHYSSETKALIKEGGGVDGGYGQKTKSAVKVFQDEVFNGDGTQIDGATGPNTWEQVAVKLEVHEGSSYLFNCNQYYVYQVTVNNGVYTYAYNSASGWNTFRQV